MKAKNFISMLRKVIREEVRSAVRQEIGNIINEKKTSTRNKKMSLTDQVRSDFETSERRVQQRKQSKQLVEYSNNPMLNDILNETANEVNVLDEYKEYPTMGGRSYNSNDVATMLGYDNIEPQQPTIQHMVPKGVNPETVTDGVADALTRDYSSLMKAIDKKKGIKK